MKVLVHEQRCDCNEEYGVKPRPVNSVLPRVEFVNPPLAPINTLLLSNCNSTLDISHASVMNYAPISRRPHRRECLVQWLCLPNS
jgi:hypothetical protein